MIIKDNTSYKYSYIPTLVDEEYHYFSDWVYKKINGLFNDIRAGKKPRINTFLVALDDYFVCYEMNPYFKKSKTVPPYKFRYLDTYSSKQGALDYRNPDWNNPELDKGGWYRDAEFTELRMAIIQTAIVQLHREGAFAGVLDTYPATIYISPMNEVYNEGGNSRLLLTIHTKDGETPPEDDFIV